MNQENLDREYEYHSYEIAKAKALGDRDSEVYHTCRQTAILAAIVAGQSEYLASRAKALA